MGASTVQVDDPTLLVRLGQKLARFKEVDMAFTVYAKTTGN